MNELKHCYMCGVFFEPKYIDEDCHILCDICLFAEDEDIDIDQALVSTLEETE